MYNVTREVNVRKFFREIRQGQRKRKSEEEGGTQILLRTIRKKMGEWNTSEEFGREGVNRMKRRREKRKKGFD